MPGERQPPADVKPGRNGTFRGKVIINNIRGIHAGETEIAGKEPFERRSRVFEIPGL